VVTVLYDEEGERLDALEKQLHKRIFLRATPSFHVEQYEVGAGTAMLRPPQPRVVQLPEEAEEIPDEPPSRPRAVAGRRNRG
jgi:hypothetical protein